jgi:hypothetical protein
MRHSRLVDDERAGGIATPLIALLAFQHVNVLEAFVTMRRYFCARGVAKQRGSRTVRRFVKHVNLHARPELLKREGSNVGWPKGPEAERAHAWSPAMWRPISATLAVSAGVS